ncbi:phage tail fiber protein [Erwinia aphidicola]|uniref:phage tail fiber domain-containing protein n=1 Tax=Erwinia aphidicola TaxID=68334 RepID=UPI00300CF6B9
MAAPTTVKVYDLDGVAKDFPVDFDYLAREFVVVTLLGGTRQELVLNVDFTFLNATTVRTSRATAWGPADGFTTIEVRRVTSAENRLVTFNDASILRAADLNLAELQTVHIAQEARDLVADGIGTDEEGQLDARNRRITNVLDPVEAQDAMTKNYYDSRINETKTYRDEALAARDKANQWATQTPAAVEGGNFSAKQYALNAGASATAADDSEAQALAYKNAAATSESNAAASASASQTSRLASEAARDIAVSAKNDAEAAAAPAIEVFNRLDALDALQPDYVKKDGSRDYTGHQKLFNSTPTDPLHAASKGYADTKLPLAGGILTGSLTLDGSGPLGQPIFMKAGSYSPHMRSNNSIGGQGGFEWINGANTSVIMTLRNDGLLTLPVRPTWGGATPWDSSNVNPARADWINDVGLEGNDVRRPYMRRASDGFLVKMPRNFSTNAIEIGWDGRMRCYVDGTHVGAFLMSNEDQNSSYFHSASGRVGRQGDWIVASGYFDVVIDGTAYGVPFNPSDARRKENIVPSTEDALEKVKQIKFYSFNFKPGALMDSSKVYKTGFIAQQLMGIDKTLVYGDDNPDMTLSPDINSLLSLSLKSIQQLSARIEALEAELAALKG